MHFFKVSKGQIRTIFAVTFGNILEWFEIYLYAYWAPILSQVFFNFNSDLANLISTYVIFGAGFLARPVGAIFFGRIGDLLGRKRSFIFSIILLTIPTFVIGVLPTYAQIGIAAPLLLGFMRLLQSFPVAGEAPGAFCYLYENASPTNKKFMTSWGGFGNQIGAILSVIESFLMEQFLSQEFLIAWGWRISFITGGLIGLLGIYLRRQLQETPSFRKLQDEGEVDSTRAYKIVNNYKQRIGLGVAFGVINASTFYLIASYIPTYFNRLIGLSMDQNAIVTLVVLVITTILLPLFGWIGDRYNIKKMLLSSALSIIILMFALYFYINMDNLMGIAVLGFLFIIPITCITAFIPYLLTNLFPTSVRYTGVALSFNIADGVIGGFTPAIALALQHHTSNPAAFCWFIVVCSVVSLVAFFKIKEQTA